MQAVLKGNEFYNEQNELVGHLIFRCIVGSTVYGTNTPESDIDYKGVFVQTVQSILVDGLLEQVEISKDEVYFEVSRFLHLAKSANPTILELLYIPDEYILYKTAEFDEIVKHKEIFLTKKCQKSFGGYAIAQIKKADGLDKKMNWKRDEVKRKTPLDFCFVYNNGNSIPLMKYLSNITMGDEQYALKYLGASRINNMRDMYSLYLDFDNYKSGGVSKFKGLSVDNSNQLRLDDVTEKEQREYITIFSYNKDGYSMHCKEYREYNEWLKNRNTQRYVDVDEHGQQIDGKNVMHCRRLLDVAMEIPVLKTINVRRPNRERLLEIRKGKNVNLRQIIEQAESDLKKMDVLYESSTLPDEVDDNIVRNILFRIRAAQLNREI